MQMIDKVRGMTKEELARFIIKYEFCNQCQYCENSLCTFVRARPNERLARGCMEACIAYLEKEVPNE